MAANKKNVAAGIIFILIAAAFAYISFDYDAGTAFRMGPAYFPRVLSGVLALLGTIILVGAFNKEDTPFGRVPYRGLLLVLLAPVVFGITIRGLGFVPAIALVSVLGAAASQRTSPLVALGATAALTIACYLIFVRGLGVPLPMFGPWLGA